MSAMILVETVHLNAKATSPTHEKRRYLNVNAVFRRPKLRVFSRIWNIRSYAIAFQDKCPPSGPGCFSLGYYFFREKKSQVSGTRKNRGIWGYLAQQTEGGKEENPPCWLDR
jgi:hypothetical protein